MSSRMRPEDLFSCPENRKDGRIQDCSSDHKVKLNIFNKH